MTAANNPISTAIISFFIRLQKYNVNINFFISGHQKTLPLFQHSQKKGFKITG